MRPEREPPVPAWSYAGQAWHKMGVTFFMTRSLFISVHDFRSLRKASIHFIAAEMARRGPTAFLSIGLSSLSLRRGDTRANLVGRANKVETVDGVECYLWRMRWHPFNMRRPVLAPVERGLFWLYRQMLPAIARKWIRRADTVFIESGMAPIFIADVRKLNPTARIIYLMSDDLEVVGCADTIKNDFVRNFDMIDTVRMPSRYLLECLPHGRSAVFAPHGIDRSIAEKTYPDPYRPGRISCVSIGSMLFDRTFFQFAAKLRPDIDFHIIGAGHAADGLDAPNIIIHPEMAFERTLSYLQHASFGVAPYRDANTPRYLLDTSLKLRQFALFGIPAVCPDFALNNTVGRYGYRPGNAQSIGQAIEGALHSSETIELDAHGWPEVVQRILTPQAYPDTHV
ncbi:glucuronosyltransferase GumK [Komagataeibacter medellinensis NBRC 3288]|uniref:Glucuronosyltransferase GumK n=2 Tax=Komagataeibacter medellinensis TaxID=1177712 RepID=G2I3M0_KOMMN|nr:glucuronosyltransferase GumK [Komagataeibacter medellinensis NBRC 3288]